MMPGRGDLCVAVEGVSKKFSRSLKRSFVYGAWDIARALLRSGESATLRASEFWAVQDVSFTLRRGQSIGVIGPNGSGKTTLMRMIAGVLRPTLGAIRVQGRIAPMLALGAGFKPVLSGRENVFLNLSLLGVSDRDIRARFDAIVEFAELAEAIDAPLGTYSSGMLARLGFACAVHTDPQILIVDEVLSVGDAKFRTKCRNRINQLRRAGTAMLLVSHSAILIQALCDECLYLKRGLIAARGTPDETLGAYESDIVQNLAVGNAARVAGCSGEASEAGHSKARILEVRFTAREASGAGIWLTGKPGEMILSVGCTSPVNDISLNVIITDLTHHAGETVQFMTSHRDIGWVRLDPGRPELRVSFPAVGLRPGTYRVKISLSQGLMHDILDVLDDARVIVRDAGSGGNGLYYQPREWTITGGTVTEMPTVPATSELEAVEEL